MIEIGCFFPRDQVELILIFHIVIATHLPQILAVLVDLYLSCLAPSSDLLPCLSSQKLQHLTITIKCMAKQLLPYCQGPQSQGIVQVHRLFVLVLVLHETDQLREDQEETESRDRFHLTLNRRQVVPHRSVFVALGKEDLDDDITLPPETPLQQSFTIGAR